MIQKQSNDPDVLAAAQRAYEIARDVLAELPKAERFDYGGHMLKLDEYGVCARCTSPIAEAQAAHQKLVERAEQEDDPLVKEHIEQAAGLFEAEASAARIRAELHNGQGSEKILNVILGFIHERSIHDTYDHSHLGGGK